MASSLPRLVVGDGRGFAVGIIAALAAVAACTGVIFGLREVIEMLLEDGEPAMESEFIGTQTVQVG